MSTDKTTSFPVRMPVDLAEKIKEAGKLTGLSQQDITRMAIAIGLEDLRRCGWDIAGAVVDKAKGPAYKAKIAEFPLAAEEPSTYKARKPTG